MYQKYIVSHYIGNECVYHGYILSDNYGRTLKSFKDLFDEASKTFDLSEDSVECGIVAKSIWCMGHAIIKFSVTEPNQEGWTNVFYHSFDVRLA